MHLYPVILIERAAVFLQGCAKETVDVFLSETINPRQRDLCGLAGGHWDLLELDRYICSIIASLKVYTRVIICIIWACYLES
jgi:hypothetical protein